MTRSGALRIHYIDKSDSYCVPTAFINQIPQLTPSRFFVFYAAIQGLVNSSSSLFTFIPNAYGVYWFDQTNRDNFDVFSLRSLSIIKQVIADLTTATELNADSSQENVADVWDGTVATVFELVWRTLYSERGAFALQCAIHQKQVPPKLLGTFLWYLYTMVSPSGTTGVGGLHYVALFALCRVSVVHARVLRNRAPEPLQ